MTVVKICGMRRREDISFANELRPDMIGFVFHRPSRRYVSPDEASSLRSRLSDGIIPVGVFVDENPLEIADIVDNGTISAVQLHGFEDDEYIRGLRRIADVPIIKTFLIRSKSDLESAASSEADMVLLDNGMGTGRTFDWSLVEDIGRDFILSGGLSPENVSDAVRRLSPYGVDVSSGVETDGYKDKEKMERFIGLAGH